MFIIWLQYKYYVRLRTPQMYVGRETCVDGRQGSTHYCIFMFELWTLIIDCHIASEIVYHDQAEPESNDECLV